MKEKRLLETMGGEKEEKILAVETDVQKREGKRALGEDPSEAPVKKIKSGEDNTSIAKYYRGWCGTFLWCLLVHREISVHGIMF